MNDELDKFRFNMNIQKTVLKSADLRLRQNAES